MGDFSSQLSALSSTGILNEKFGQLRTARMPPPLPPPSPINPPGSKSKGAGPTGESCWKKKLRSPPPSEVNFNNYIYTIRSPFLVLSAAPDLGELGEREPLRLGHEEEDCDAAGVRDEAVAHEHRVHPVLRLQRRERLEGGEGGEVPEITEIKHSMRCPNRFNTRNASAESHLSKSAVAEQIPLTLGGKSSPLTA